MLSKLQLVKEKKFKTLLIWKHQKLIFLFVSSMKTVFFKLCNSNGFNFANLSFPRKLSICYRCSNIFAWKSAKWASLVAQTVKYLPAVQKTQVQSLGREDPLEKGIATHSSILA